MQGNLDSFQLLDGSRYFYDTAEVCKQLFLHAYDLQLGQVGEPPELYQKLCQAKDAETILAVLERLAPENPEHAFVSPSEIYDRAVLLNERRLVPLVAQEPEDLSEQ